MKPGSQAVAEEVTAVAEATAVADEAAAEVVVQATRTENVQVVTVVKEAEAKVVIKETEVLHLVTISSQKAVAQVKNLHEVGAKVVLQDLDRPEPTQIDRKQAKRRNGKTIVLN